MKIKSQNLLLPRTTLNKNIRIFTMAIILLGIIMRLVIYFQNRCLFIDEANVARNIYERNFAGLARPLNYEQFAPPVFLWIIKCCTALFGYSEYALRLFPLICGIAMLFAMYHLLRIFKIDRGSWYALILMAVGTIYIQYAAEVKQYSCDGLVAILLFILAIRRSIVSTSTFRFLGAWFLAGSLCIWLSMPSVFILAGVGAYYFTILLQERAYKKLPVLFALAAIWLLQFGCYYFLILKLQINSSFLQNCHKDFFLTPSFFFDALAHNTDVLNALLAHASGKWTLSVTFHLLAIAIGIVWLFKNYQARLWLLSVPVAALLAAAFANQYALTARLVLFIMPVILLLIAVGVHLLLQIKFTAVKILMLAVAAICIINFGQFDLFYKRWEHEEITQNMTYLKEQHLTAQHVYVDEMGTPAFIYYTTINPTKDKWSSVAQANLLHWNSNYDSLAHVFNGRSALLTSWQPDDVMSVRRAILKKYHKEVAVHKVTGGTVYVYE